MSLARTLRRLELDWTTTVRRHSPRDRWAGADPVLDVDLDVLRRRLSAVMSSDGRRLLAALVGCAVDGDEAAAQLVMLTLLPRMVRVEARYADGDYAGLASTLWLAIVTSTGLDRRYLREDIERRAWRALFRGRDHRSVTPTDVVPECSTGDDTAEQVVGRVTLSTTLDSLERRAVLSPDGRRLLEQLAAGATSPISRSAPGSVRAMKRRERTLRRVRSAEVHEALAS